MAFNLSSMKVALKGIEDSRNSKELDIEKFSLIFFDTETTGLKPTSEIIQIAARCGDKHYNEYIIPDDGIPKFITGLTGFSLVEGRMYNREGELVKAVTKESAVGSFIQYLKSIEGEVILIAHNCFRFDAPMLLTLLHQNGMMEDFQRIVNGFSDTLPLFKEFLPGRCDQGKNYKLVSMASEFLGDCCGAHDAMNDVIMMQNLVNHPRINIEDFRFIESRKTVGELLAGIGGRLKGVDMQREYRKLKAEGRIGMSDDLIERLVSSGIGMQDLRGTLRTGGAEAVHQLLDEKLKKSIR